MEIKEHSRNLYKHEVEQYLNNENCETKEDVLRILFGDDGSSDLVIKYRFPDMESSRLIHRLNTLWIYPIFILLIPFRYLMFGEYKVNEHTKLGKCLSFLLGNY